MYSGFRGGFGAPLGGTNSRGTYFNPDGFPGQTGVPPTFNNPEPTQGSNSKPPAEPPAPSNPTPRANNNANGGQSSNNGGDSSGVGGDTPAAVSNDNNVTGRTSIGTTNPTRTNVVTRSVTLPAPPVTTITTTASLDIDDALSTSSPIAAAKSISAQRRDVVPVGLIVGVLFGGIFLAIALVFGFLWLRRRKRKKEVIGATPYHDSTQVDVQSKGRFGADRSNYLPPYSPPATSSFGGSTQGTSTHDNEKQPLSSAAISSPKTAMQVANRESVTEAGGTRMSASTFNTACLPPRYASLYQISSRPNTRTASRQLPFPPTILAQELSDDFDSDALSYVSPTEQAGPSKTRA